MSYVSEASSNKEMHSDQNSHRFFCSNPEEEKKESAVDKSELLDIDPSQLRFQSGANQEGQETNAKAEEGEAALQNSSKSGQDQDQFDEMPIPYDQEPANQEKDVDAQPGSEWTEFTVKIIKSCTTFDDQNLNLTQLPAEVQSLMKMSTTTRIVNQPCATKFSPLEMLEQVDGV